MPELPPTVDRQIVQLYFQLLGPVKRVLDLGCGRGDVGRHRPRLEIVVIGLDRDRRALVEARQYERVAVWDGNSRRLPFRDGEFCAVIAKDILEHIQEPWHIVAEMNRVLKPGGAGVVSVPMARARAVWDDYTHVRGFTSRAIRALFEDCGFTAGTPLSMGGVPLAGRLGIARFVPVLLKLPILNYFFGTSYMLVVRKSS